MWSLFVWMKKKLVCFVEVESLLRLKLYGMIGWLVIDIIVLWLDVNVLYVYFFNNI